MGLLLASVALSGGARAVAEVLHEPVRIRPLDCRDGICRSSRPGASTGGAPGALPEAILSSEGQLIPPPDPSPVGAAEIPWSPLDVPSGQDPDTLPPIPGELVPPAAAAKHRVGQYQIDADTGPESGKHPYEEVFRPSLYPFKRSTALDLVVAGPCRMARPGCKEPALAVAHPELQPRRIESAHRSASYDYFWGELAIELASDRPTPLPSPGPEAVVVAYQATPGQALELFVDSAENWYVRGRRSGRARLVWLTGVPKRAFGAPIDPDLRIGDLPPMLRPPFPGELRPLVAPVLAKLGLTKITASSPFAPTLDTLVAYFRSFETKVLPTASGSTYVNLALGQAGSCRHRSFAFVVTAQALGLAARYIENELHVFVEVYVPNRGWQRIHLGGAGVDSERIGPTTIAHQPPEDTLPKPPPFVAGEQQAARRSGTGAGDKASAERKGTTTRRSGGFGTASNGPVGSGAGRGEDRRIVPMLIAELTGSSTFRGETVEVRGHAVGVEASDGPLPGLSVYVVLAGPEGRIRLGEGITDARGEYRIPIEIPRAIPLGDYRVLVLTDGDDRRAPAVSQ